MNSNCSKRRRFIVRSQPVKSPIGFADPPHLCRAVATTLRHRTDGSQSCVSLCRRWLTGRLPGPWARVRHPQVLCDVWSCPPTTATFVCSRTSSQMCIASCRRDRPHHRIFEITICNFYHTPPRLRLPRPSSPAIRRTLSVTIRSLYRFYISINLFFFIRLIMPL